MMNPEDTIAAISTPFGEGAIAVLRLSGERAIEIADEVFRSREKLSNALSRYQQFGKIIGDEERIDDVLLTVFRAPASYTGEDVVEISCHGGILVSRRILQLLLSRGARLANPGEFTQRAFLNGKMDLTQAEAVMDLIRAQTNLALRAAAGQLEGELGKRIWRMRDALLEVVAHVEAYIDFPEEGIDPDTGCKLRSKVDAVHEELTTLLKTADQGRVLREGVRTVIYGAPNVGKSSLLNLLLGYERAIVTEHPGTTRDTIEEVINLRGIPLRLIDTAGVRHSVDEIEQQGITRALKHIETADLVLHVVDGSQDRAHYLWASEVGTRKNEVLVVNKKDLGEHESWKEVPGVRISCLTKDGIEELSQEIFHRVMGGEVQLENVIVAINARHQACLQRALQFCEAGIQMIEDQISPELIAIELRAALDAVGEIVGKADTEELLGRIFSTFCIGK
jgi:tRNA modification GTPase